MGGTRDRVLAYSGAGAEVPGDEVITGVGTGGGDDHPAHGQPGQHGVVGGQSAHGLGVGQDVDQVGGLQGLTHRCPESGCDHGVDLGGHGRFRREVHGVAPTWVATNDEPAAAGVELHQLGLWVGVFEEVGGGGQGGVAAQVYLDGGSEPA